MAMAKQDLYLGFEVLTAVTMKNAVFWDGRGVALVTTDVLKGRVTSPSG
jgi:hypothetical protein